MPYYVYIEGQFKEDNEGCIATYWYKNDSLAKAIRYAVEDAKSRLGLTESRVDSVLFDENEELPEDTILTETENLLIFTELHIWEFSPDDHDFVFPVGIVPANIKGPFELEEIKEGYFKENTEDQFSINVVIDGRNFHEKVIKIFNTLPSKDGFEIDIKNHWNNKDISEIWLADPTFKNDKILSYIFNNQDGLINNGGIEIAIYCRKEKATLRITDHKIVNFYAGDMTLIDTFEENLQKLGLSKLKKKRMLSRKYHHYHYCPLESLSADSFKQQLESDNFKKVDEVNEKNT